LLPPYFCYPAGKLGKLKRRNLTVGVIVCGVCGIQGRRNFYDIKTGETVDVSKIKDVFAFCGIGQPEQFYNYLKPYNLLGTKSFNDHYAYSVADIKDIIQNAKNNGAKYIITTEKDAVKLANLSYKADFEVKILVMKLKPEIDIVKILSKTGLEV